MQKVRRKSASSHSTHLRDFIARPDDVVARGVLEGIVLDEVVDVSSESGIVVMLMVHAQARSCLVMLVNPSWLFLVLAPVHLLIFALIAHGDLGKKTRPETLPVLHDYTHTKSLETLHASSASTWAVILRKSGSTSREIIARSDTFRDWKGSSHQLIIPNAHIA